MSLFKTTWWKWWQIGILKLCVLSFGIVIGSYWPEIFLPYLTELLILTIALGIYVSVVYFRQG